MYTGQSLRIGAPSVGTRPSAVGTYRRYHRDIAWLDTVGSMAPVLRGTWLDTVGSMTRYRR